MLRAKCTPPEPSNNSSSCGSHSRCCVCRFEYFSSSTRLPNAWPECSGTLFSMMTRPAKEIVAVVVVVVVVVVVAVVVVVVVGVVVCCCTVVAVAVVVFVAAGVVSGIAAVVAVGWLDGWMGRRWLVSLYYQLLLSYASFYFFYVVFLLILVGVIAVALLLSVADGVIGLPIMLVIIRTLRLNLCSV